MKKAQVKVLETNPKSFKVEYNNQSLWIQKRSLTKNNMVSMKVIEKGLSFMQEVKANREDYANGVEFTIAKETDKAYGFLAEIEVYVTDEVGKKLAFVPKSIIQENGNMPTWFANKKRKEIVDSLGSNYRGQCGVRFL